MKHTIGSGIVALAIIVALTSAADAAPPAGPARTAAIEVALRDGGEVRTYQLTSVATADPHCVAVREQAKDQLIQIGLCLRTDAGGGFQVDVDWKTESNGSSYQTQSSAVIAAGGALELGGKVRRLTITAR